MALFGGDVARADAQRLRRQLAVDGGAPTLEHGWLDAMDDVESAPADERMPAEAAKESRQL